MKAALSFKFQPENSVMIWQFIAIIWTLFWVVWVASESTTDFVVGAKIWVLGTCLLLAVTGWQRARLIVSGAQVLCHLRTPQPLWRAWLHGCMRVSLWAWGILLVAGTVLLLAPNAPWRWSSAMALFSTALSLSTIAALSDAGVLHRAWA